MEKNEDLPEFSLHAERIKMPDGRYLIFYTFENSFQNESGSLRDKTDPDPDKDKSN